MQPNESPAGVAPFGYNPRFPGLVFDAFLGVNCNYFQDYDPNTGRYLKSDPIGLKDGINTYGYVGGNPVSFSDSLGLAPDGHHFVPQSLFRSPCFAMQA